MAWVAVAGVLWMRRIGGEILASSANPAALDDLEWLGIEPDAMVSRTGPDHLTGVAAELTEQKKAYTCFCGSSEAREMLPLPSGDPEPIRYDRRCMPLSDTDRAALLKSGRKAVVRLVHPTAEEAPVDVRGRALPALPPVDFIFLSGDGKGSRAFELTVADHRAEASHTVMVDTDTTLLAQQAALRASLGWLVPETLVLSPLAAPDRAPLPTLGELRGQGFHPLAVRRALLALCGIPAGIDEIDEAAAEFELSWLPTGSPVFDTEELRKANGEVLRALDPAELLQVVGEHLTRRGYPFFEQDQDWQERFAHTAVADVCTLAETETLASLILTATVDYDKEAARALRNAGTQELVDAFHKILGQIDSQDPRAWREALQALRRDVSAPGRALAILRLVLTGQREGPSLPSLLSLLGADRCRVRLEKAQRYAANA